MRRGPRVYAVPEKVRNMTALNCLEKFVEIVVRKVKGRNSEEDFRRGHGVHAVPEEVQYLTALTFLEKFVALRSSYSEYLFSPEAASPDGCTGTKVILTVGGVNAPEGCCYCSNSMGLVSFREGILMGRSLAE